MALQGIERIALGLAFTAAALTSCGTRVGSPVQGAALQNATASTACQPSAPNDAPQPGTGRHF